MPANSFLTSSIEPLYQYLNDQHPNIKYTMENEKNNSIPFLDILISRTDNNKVKCSVFRKPTFTGLGLHYLSACYDKFKITNLYTFFYRAYILSSDFLLFHTEIQFLNQYFLSNGYPIFIFYKHLRNFLDRIYLPRQEKIGPKKNIVYFKLPYISDACTTLYKSELHKLFSRYYPQIDLRLTFTNSLTIGKLLLNSKNYQVPKHLC